MADNANLTTRSCSSANVESVSVASGSMRLTRAERSPGCSVMRTRLAVSKERKATANVASRALMSSSALTEDRRDLKLE